MIALHVAVHDVCGVDSFRFPVRFTIDGSYPGSYAYHHGSTGYHTPLFAAYLLESAYNYCSIFVKAKPPSPPPRSDFVAKVRRKERGSAERLPLHGWPTFWVSPKAITICQSADANLSRP